MPEIKPKIIDWTNSLAEFHMPRWDELPEIEMYSDQVVSYIDKYLKDLFIMEEKIITVAMMYNYVKLKLMPKPEKKRYNRTHIGYLITITILKQVLEIADVRDGIVLQIKKSSEEQAYNLFCDELEYAIKVMTFEIFDKQAERQYVVNGSFATRMAAFAFVSKILAQYIININSASIQS